ncbi:DMT family transporter [Anaeroselena agilis]|uniref:DMT family transporter n=1 Tax=Anaeroselena agilis TaxID=3063788 RepID=A0ABU3P2N0_9FIRM|nr:DMT family transporter [Selenomonadales bacterium 4137-cl]
MGLIGDKCESSDNGGRSGEGFALVAGALWGVNYVVVKLVLATVPEPLFLLIRFGAAISLLLAYAAWRGENARIAPGDVLPVILLGLFGVGVQNVTWTYGIHRTTVSSAALLICTAPLFTLLFSVITGRERAGMLRLLGTAAAFAGIYVIVVTTPGSRLEFSSAAFVGNLLILASALLFAFYSLASQPLLRRYSAVKLFTLASIVAVPVLVANAALAPPQDDVRLSGQLVLEFLYLEFLYIVVFGTIVAFVCWFQGIGRTSPVRTTLYQYTTPLVSTLLSVTMLGEPFSGGQAAGAALICGGLMAARYDRTALTGSRRRTGKAAISP